MKEMNKEEWEDEKACNELREKWLVDYDDVFKEDLEETDRIQMEPVVVDLVENHQEIETYHPKTPLDVPAYLEEAARKELQRMLTAGMLEPDKAILQHSQGTSLWRNQQNQASL